MSAIVCGKRSFFDELNASSSSPVSKKLRCASSTSPVRFSPFSPPPVVGRTGLVDKLKEAFPLLDQQLLEQALEECGDDIDAAIKRLNELCLWSSSENSANVVEEHVEQGGLAANDQPAAPTDDSSAQNNIPADGARWVELLVGEMLSASTMDVARARAAKILEALEKNIITRAGAEATEKYQKENMMLKEQIQAVMGENTILKRIVQKFHERQKEYEDSNREGQQLKQLVSQYHEQIKNLEWRNNALTRHLEQIQRSSLIPGNFNRDIF